MVKVQTKVNCGNSPKMRFIENFNMAFAKGDTAFIAKSVTDDIVWNRVGDKAIIGKEDLMQNLTLIKDPTISEMAIEKIITHGKEGSANGTVKMTNGEIYAFADIYEFNSAKATTIKSITSFLIKV
ncbi:MAG: nuclear transport factor 2 family protein [Pricia sp.]|nr:nuclear transport factor 2 family protein [Pricia sp.]